jgi:murein DD-endopeptidase MepM/ murein hydrolase activator NlpD
VATKYRYNPETLAYEPVRLTGKALAKKVLIFLSIALTISIAGSFWYVDQFAPLEEQFLSNRNKTLRMEWRVLETELTKKYNQLSSLSEQDDKNYRVILDMNPLSAEERQAGVGGAEITYDPEVERYMHIKNLYTRLEKLKHQLDVEMQSYEQLNKIATGKITMWASRPAIQPISNKDLSRLHTTYGTRFHPIFNQYRDHKGLDFTAPKGTPVYATGDGRVSMAYYSSSYGNVVYLDHGFDYETRYAHLSAFNVHPGQFVRRGEVIGYVGNTGISAAPHLHYEVLREGNHINPINFFQRDLSNKEYERLISISHASSNGPLD